MTTPEADERGRVTPNDTPPTASEPADATSHPVPFAAADSQAAEAESGTGVAAAAPARADAARFGAWPPSVETDATAPLVARAASPAQQQVLYVPLAVSIGDGFKLGCGFFLAAVLAMLVGFVLIAALFVLTGLLGLNLPLTR